jgi:4-amino-4-deoxychorismate lyase
MATLSIAYDHPALIYGASVFTTCRIYEGDLDHPLTLWNAHRDRLQASLETWGWIIPDWEQVRAGIQAIQKPIARITLFPQGEELVFGRDLPPDLELKQSQGITAQVIQGCDRSLPQHKTGNYLAPWLAKQQVGSQSEAILVDAQGQWLETSTGNLWGWDGRDYYSPPLAAGILPGIAREYLMQWLATRGKIVNEQPWDQNLVNRLKALAYSNSVVQLVPIVTVNNGIERHYPREIWRELRAAFTENRKKTSATSSAGNERKVNIS